MQPRTLKFLKKELNWKAQKSDNKFEFSSKELAALLEKYLKDFTDKFPGTYNEMASYKGTDKLWNFHNFTVMVN